MAGLADRVMAQTRALPRRRPVPGAARVRNLPLLTGLLLVGALVVLGLAGPAVVGTAGLKLGGAEFRAPPSAAHPLGTDTTGRDVLTFLLHAIIPSLVIGLIAGGAGTLTGTALGLLTGYLRGPVDTVVRTAADIAMTIPSLAVLVVISAFVRTTSIELMALIVALFSWPYPTRAIRAQTLALREQAFVQLAKLSGRSELAIAFLELLPNLLPYIMAGFVGAVNGGILASVGLQLLGLGPRHVPTLGLMLEEAFNAGALIRGFWWWWAPPAGVLAVLFLGLFLISMGLDEIANPRLRRQRIGSNP
jgi:peptide/nickel transport system permease protein